MQPVQTPTKRAVHTHTPAKDKSPWHMGIQLLGVGVQKETVTFVSWSPSAGGKNWNWKFSGPEDASLGISPFGKYDKTRQHKSTTSSTQGDTDI